MRLFVADAHLSASRPARAESFFSFLRGAARRAKALYLLGDTFDSWAGDDDDSALSRETRAALSALRAAGTAAHIQRGNRDFLLGRRFCRDAGCILLPDLHDVECGGRRFLLAHGDAFCGDAAYLRYRAIARSRLFFAAAGALPLSWRRAAAARMGETSRARGGAAALSRAKMTAQLRRRNCGALIHGHLHRAETEEWTDDGAIFVRRGLPDWEGEKGGWLEMDENGALELKSA